jgi:hypothetical protein
VIVDEGTAYGLAGATYDKELTEVGAGTPMASCCVATGIRSALPPMPGRRRGRCAFSART